MVQLFWITYNEVIMLKRTLGDHQNISQVQMS
jgi:hypothetical protein